MKGFACAVRGFLTGPGSARQREWPLEATPKRSNAQRGQRLAGGRAGRDSRQRRQRPARAAPNGDSAWRKQRPAQAASVRKAMPQRRQRPAGAAPAGKKQALPQRLFRMYPFFIARRKRPLRACPRWSWPRATLYRTRHPCFNLSHKLLLISPYVLLICLICVFFGVCSLFL